MSSSQAQYQAYQQSLQQVQAQQGMMGSAAYGGGGGLQQVWQPSNLNQVPTPMQVIWWIVKPKVTLLFKRNGVEYVVRPGTRIGIYPNHSSGDFIVKAGLADIHVPMTKLPELQKLLEKEYE